MALLFKVEWSVAEHDAMRAVALRDAKTPSIPFIEDTKKKRQSATDALRAAAEHWVATSFRKLEAFRTRT